MTTFQGWTEGLLVWETGERQWGREEENKTCQVSPLLWIYLDSSLTWNIEFAKSVANLLIAWSPNLCNKVLYFNVSQPKVPYFNVLWQISVALLTRPLIYSQGVTNIVSLTRPLLTLMIYSQGPGPNFPWPNFPRTQYHSVLPIPPSGIG